MEDAGQEQNPIGFLVFKMKKDETNFRIVRQKKSKEEPYLILANRLIDDNRLSNQTLGFIIRILRQIDFYRLTQCHFNKLFDARTRNESALKELIKYGYCHKVTHSQRKVEFTFYELPELNPYFVAENLQLINTEEKKLSCRKPATNKYPADKSSCRKSTSQLQEINN